MKLSIISTHIILILTTPWFSGVGADILFGLPSWVVVSFFITLLYGFVIGLQLQFYWHTPEEGEL